MISMYAIIHNRPFTGHFGVIQRNGIRSWLKLRCKPQVTLLGQGAQLAAPARELGVRHVDLQPDPELDQPLIGDGIQLAHQHARHDIRALVCPELIFMDDFCDAVALVAQTFERFLIVGRVCSLEVNSPLTYTDEAPWTWVRSLRYRVRTQGFMHNGGMVAYLVYRGLDFSDMPRYGLGAGYYDHWLIYHARQTETPVVDITGQAMVVHQAHDGRILTGEVWENNRAQGTWGEAHAGAAIAGYCIEDNQVVRGTPRLPLGVV